MSDIFDISLDSVRENVLENMLSYYHIKLEKERNIALLTSADERFILSDININYDLYINLMPALKGIDTLIIGSETITFDLKEGSMDFKGLNIMFDSVAFYCEDKFKIKSSKPHRILSNLNILSKKNYSNIIIEGKQIVLENCNFNAYNINFEIEPILDNSNLNIKFATTNENDNNKDLIKRLISIITKSKTNVSNQGLPIYKYNGNILDIIKKFIDISNSEYFSIHLKNTYKFIIYSKRGQTSSFKEGWPSFQIQCCDGYLDVGNL